MPTKAARPAIVTLMVVLVGVPAGIAVLIGAYSITAGRFEATIGLSFLNGIVLMMGLNAVWERKYGGWPLAVATMVVGLVLSVVAQVFLSSTVSGVPIGVSWIVTMVSAAGLAILFLPPVRSYFAQPK